MTTKWKVIAAAAGGPSNPGPSSWGTVVMSPNGANVSPVNGYLGWSTTQAAEITAAIEGLSRTPEGATVELISHSQYLLSGLKEWRSGWERRGFKNAHGQPIANQDLWKPLFTLVDLRKISTRLLKDHKSDQQSERAIALAADALRNGRTLKPVTA